MSLPRRPCASALASIAGLVMIAAGLAPAAAAAPSSEPPAPQPAPVAPATAVAADAGRPGPAAGGSQGPARASTSTQAAPPMRGLCAAALPSGRVRIPGPGGTTLTAQVSGAGTDPRRLRIVGATGRIGGVVVQSADATGSLMWAPESGGTGRMSGRVRIALPDTPKVSRSWSQTVTVTASPNGCGWSASVGLSARGDGASLTMRGPLAADGTYVLRGRGVVSIHSATVPVRGWLGSAGRTLATSQRWVTERSVRPEWYLSGRASEQVAIPGARLSRIAVRLTDVVQVPVGSADVSLPRHGLTTTARLTISGAATWSARVDGANRGPVTIPTTTMTFLPRALAGTIGMSRGRPAWRLVAPGTFRWGQIRYTTRVGLIGPRSYSVRAASAQGPILGLAGTRRFTAGNTQLIVAPSGTTGALTVTTRGNLLLQLNPSWRTSADLVLRPVSGSGRSFRPWLSQAMSVGKGTIRLTGTIGPRGSVNLVASGSLDVAGSLVPVRGYYRRSGFGPSTRPVWALAAFPSESARGRIPLQGGAGLVGGAIVFGGPGSQPVSTIRPADTADTQRMAASSAMEAAATPTPVVSGGQTLTTVAYDGFSYATGDVAGASGGAGWTGAWAMLNTAGGKDNVQSVGMTYPNLATAGGSIKSASGGNGVNGYGRPLPTMSSGVVYLQLLTNFGTQTGGGTPTIRLIDSATGAIRGGIGNNGQPTMAILDANLNPVAASSVSMNGNLLTVVRIDYGAKTTSMWVNPDLSTFDYANPPTPSATATNLAPQFSRIEIYTRSGQVFDEISVMTLNPPPVPVTVTGTTSVQLSDNSGDTFYLPVTYTYTDANNWTATVAGTTPSNLYGPFVGLEIPETDFSGTITDVNGKQTWNVSIAMQDWVGVADGIDYKGAFTISNTCPLDNQDACPEEDGIFIGGHSDLEFTSSDVPSAKADGAFLTDLSWAYWEATVPGSVTFNTITMSNPTLTVARGGAVGQDHPELILPDLSGINGNGMNVEFCSNFEVTIPKVKTSDVLGCAAWSADGVVIGQVNTGGSMATGDYNGITVKQTQLNGYAWNGLPDAQTISLNGVEIEAEQSKNYITADVVVPGNAMHDFGTGKSSDTDISVSGWFDLEGNFDLEGTIPVNLSGSGFTLQEIVISVSKEATDEGDEFALKFDAHCDVVVKGNHFPLDVYIGYQKAGDTTITVGLTATGTRSTQPGGQMDFVNLLPSGDFEPTNAVLADGSFDGQLPDDSLNDGGFERSIDPGNLVANGDFEQGMGANALPGGDFDNGMSDNLLSNGGFESTNILVNGDFEENGGSLSGWYSTNTSASPISTTTISSGGPPDTGPTIAKVSNSNVSNNTGNGLQQFTVSVNLAGSSTAFSVWAAGSSSGYSKVYIRLVGVGCKTSTSYDAQDSVTAGQWKKLTAGGAFGDGCNVLSVTVTALDPGTSIYVDGAAVNITPTTPTTVPNTTRPSVVGTFESLASSPLQSGYSGVSIANDVPKTLWSTGTSSWLTRATAGPALGSFDVSYRVMFPTGTNDRDIANFGFWLNGGYSNLSGYCFRLQTANGDGGFFKCTNASKSFIGTKAAPDVQRGHWYQVHLMATTKYITAYVQDQTDTSAPIFTDTVYLSSPPAFGGAFGQVPDFKSTSVGIRWDDLAFNSLETSNAYAAPSAAQPPAVVLGAKDAHSGTGRASLLSGSSDTPYEYSTGISPVNGGTYSYSAWVRAASGTVSGSLSLTGIGGINPDDTSSVSFTVGTTWKQVTTVLNGYGWYHTDLRPRITVSTPNSELYLDDQVLQQVPIYPYDSSAEIQVVSDQAHSGLNSLRMNPTKNGCSIWYLPKAPEPWSTVTVTAWVMSPTGVNASLRLQEHNAASIPFTANGAWQQVTASLQMLGDSGAPYISFDYVGQPGNWLYVDDITVTVTELSSSSSKLGAPPGPAGWTAKQDGSPATPLTTDTVSYARSGEGVLRIDPWQNGTLTDTYVTTTTPAVGSTWNLTFWARAAGDTKNVTASLSAGAGGSVQTTVNLSTTEYTKVSLQLQVKGTSAGPLTVAISSTGLYHVVYVDDLSLTEDGYTPRDGWSTPNGALSYAGFKDSANAHSGDGYLSLTNNGTSTQSLTTAADYQPVAGATHSLAFWVRAAGGAAAGSATLFTTDSNGTRLDQASVPISATSQWQLVTLSMPITKTSAVKISVALGVNAGQSFLVDDMTSRDLQTWAAVQPSGGGAMLAVVENAPDPVDGANYLRVSTPASGGGVGATLTTDTQGKAVSVAVGSSYAYEAYVRSTTGTPLSGTMSLAAESNGSQTDKASVSFTAGADWTPIEVQLTATKSANTLVPRIVLGSGGQFDVDAMAVTPKIIAQEDPWSASGGGVTWQVVDDPANAHDSSLGVMKLTTSSGGTGVQHSVSSSGTAGDVLSATAFVRSSSGAAISGSFVITATGGSPMSWKSDFTATSAWKPVNVPITLTSSCSGFTVQVLSTTPGTTLYVDDVALVANPWTSTNGAIHTIFVDGPAAQSGNGYMVLTPRTSSGGTYLDMPASDDIGGTYDSGSSWTVTAHIRSASPNGALGSGTLALGSPDGSSEVQEFGVGSNWLEISVPYTPGTDLSSLRVTVTVYGSSAPIAIDSITLAETGDLAVDGISTPLPHPQSGYVYLWDDAFGIPGSHLWSITAQVMFEAGVPGLGVGATVYQDPTKMPNVMTGTDWVKGDMALNISDAEPCFLFDFSADGGNSGVSLSGVFTTKDFALNFAPRGCTVGPYTLPKGASLSFDGELGDGTLHFDLAITEGDDGPEFSESIGVTNIVIGGTTFKEGELDVLLTNTEKKITFAANMELPMGTFVGSYDLTATEEDLHMDGDVSLSDWHAVGGGFNVEDFNFHMEMDVPFGEGQCGSFDESASGHMDMAQKVDLTFDGRIAVDCGRLTTLHLRYDYHHGGVTQDFILDYDEDTHILAGGTEFQFERETSWKSWFHRYTRHPYFMIELGFSIDFDSPSSAAQAVLAGSVSVSDGDGSVECHIYGGSASNWADDECSLHVHLDPGGGHTYDANW